MTGACQMNTRYHWIAPAQSIATSQASFASWHEPASFLEPGEAYCSLPGRSIAEPPTSTVGPHPGALRDRRDARVDAMATGLAVDVHNVFADAQTLAGCERLLAQSLAATRKISLGLLPVNDTRFGALARKHVERIEVR